MPSIHIIDKSMANTSVTIPQLKADLVKINRGKMVESNGSPNGNGEPYHRFAFSPDGVSPRALLGSGHRFWNSGDEHDEMGHIEEDPFNRISMMDKRMTKLETAEREILLKEKGQFFSTTQKNTGATPV